MSSVGDGCGVIRFCEKQKQHINAENKTASVNFFIQWFYAFKIKIQVHKNFAICIKSNYCDINCSR